MPTRPIPRSWNDRVLWLLEALVGLPDLSTGVSLPLGVGASPVLHRYRANLTAQGAATETAIQLPTTTRHWLVVGFAFFRTAGTGATYTPRVGEIVTFVADSANQRLAYAATAVATPTQAIYTAPIPIRADSANKIYFRPGFDAGADNTCTVELWLQQALATSETT